MFSNEQIARRYYDLFNVRRFDEAEMLVSTDSVFRYPHTKDNLIGRAGYRELVRLWILAFPDAKAEIRRVTSVSDEIVDVDILGRGTHSGPLSFGGTLSLPATGTSAELPLKDKLTIRNQQITESTFQFDMKEMLRRLIGWGSSERLPRGVE